MTVPFPGFPPDALTFLADLERNNHPEWFLPRKQLYLQLVRAPMEALVTALNAQLLRFAPDHVTEPSRAIYRIYRDTRFSADKTPYKTHIAAIFPRRGRPKHASAALYCSISPREVEVAAGVYLPPPDFLLALRRHIAAHPNEFQRLATAPRLRKLFGPLLGEKLSRPPKGFSPHHPAIAWLLHKQWYFDAILHVDLATSPSLFSEILKRFRAAAPFVAFLNQAAPKPPRIPLEEFLR